MMFFQFDLGRLFTTPAAVAAINSEYMLKCVTRHVQGDWGIVCVEDHAANEEALRSGERLMSVYPIAERGSETSTFWIITEADRSATTVLLPDDY